MNKGRQRPFAAIVQTHFDEALAARGPFPATPLKPLRSSLSGRGVAQGSLETVRTSFLFKFGFSRTGIRPGSEPPPSPRTE